MRLKFGAFVITLLLLAPQQLYAATKVTPGAACPKVNATQIFNSKKYTCVKSGSKLKWNQGVSISPLASIPNATPPLGVSEMNAINADGYGWTVGKEALGFMCWRGIGVSDAAVLQVKKDGKWLSKQRGYLVRNSEKCTSDYPDGFFFNWVVDEFGDGATTNRSKALMARVVIYDNYGGLKASGEPFTRETYNSEADRIADFMDVIKGMSGGSNSGTIGNTKIVNCTYKGKPLYGRVYYESSSIFADFNVYVTNSSFADLKVYEPSSSIFANQCGLWYRASSKIFSDFSVYVTSSSAFADFSISHTNSSIFAGTR